MPPLGQGNKLYLVRAAEGYAGLLFLFAFFSFFPEFMFSSVRDTAVDIVRGLYGVAPIFPALFVGFFFFDGICIIFFCEWMNKKAGEAPPHSLRVIALLLFLTGAILVWKYWYICLPEFCH